MGKTRSIEIHVPVLARVEGEGALDLVVRDGRIEQLQLRIFEPPRLFEKFLEGREYRELPDMVARICGICPVAYQMSAVQALESLCGHTQKPAKDAAGAVGSNGWVESMRRVFYCGEWIQSHSLHIHLLALPDFLGFGNAIDMAKVHPQVVHRGLRLQAVGNAIIRLLGARSVHPVGVRVGGFHHAPDVDEVQHLIAELEPACADAAELVQWIAALDMPQATQRFTSVALRHGTEYPMYQGRIVSDKGLNIAIAEFEKHIKEYQVPHSTALHAMLEGSDYLVGPLARLNLNHDRLPQALLSPLTEQGIRFPSNNMFHSLAARAVELHYALLEALRLLRDYRTPSVPYQEMQPAAGVAYGATEAPRGLLWHRYEIDATGIIRRARIVPPTSQNQARMERDLRLALEAFGLDRDDAALRQHGETVIRNYDPCISCATHFLRLKVIR